MKAAYSPSYIYIVTLCCVVHVPVIEQIVYRFESFLLLLGYSADFFFLNIMN